MRCVTLLLALSFLQTPHAPGSLIIIAVVAVTMVMVMVVVIVVVIVLTTMAT